MPTPCVLTIGNFDGVHLGHRAIVREARRLAAAHGPQTPTVAVTFDPPPIAILRPGSQPPQIDTLDQRTTHLQHAGVNHVETIPVNADWLAKSADAFIEELVQRFAPVAIVEGPDFRFGKNRAGDHALLTRLGRSLGFDALRLPREHATLGDRQSVPVSSSLIRWLIGRGRVSDAAVCLGRPFTLTATIIQGEQRGRTLGIPTANLDPDALLDRIVPADGVYAAHATTHDGQTFPAAVSIGTKPTFHHASHTTVEAHLLGYHGDLYGQTLTLRFVRWVRDQYAFPGVDSLVAQLHRDLQHADALPIPNA